MTMNTKSWYGKAFISVESLNGVEAQLQTKTTSLKVTGGGFEIEGVETFGGTVNRVGTRDDMEISFDGLAASHADFDWIFAGQTSSTQSGLTGAAITTSTITPYRVTFLWTNYTGSVTSAAKQAFSGSTECYRKSYANAYCNNLETDMDAGDHLKAHLTFQLTEEDDSGLKNWNINSKDTSAVTMAALGAFTSSATKW